MLELFWVFMPLVGIVKQTQTTHQKKTDSWLIWDLSIKRLKLLLEQDYKMEYENTIGEKTTRRRVLSPKNTCKTTATKTFSSVLKTGGKQILLKTFLWPAKWGNRQRTSLLFRCMKDTWQDESGSWIPCSLKAPGFRLLTIFHFSENSPWRVLCFWWYRLWQLLLLKLSETYCALVAT